MAYMYSLNATANSQTTMLVDFDVKTDPNTDLILTQSREQLAASQLPPEVNNYGVTIKKSTTAPLMLVSLYSPHGTRDATFLANYAYINLNDPIARLYGVGQTNVFGAGQYAMRLWVKPDQLAKLGHHGHGYRQRHPGAEHRQPRRSGGRRAGAARPAIHLFRARSGTPDFAGTIRRRDRAGSAEWRDRSREGRGAHRTGRAGLQHCQPPERPAQRDHRGLPVARLQRGSDGRRRQGS